MIGNRGLGQSSTSGLQPGWIIGSDGKPVNCNNWWTSFWNFDCGAAAFGIDTSPQGSQTNPLSSVFGSMATPVVYAVVAGVGLILLVSLVRR